MCLPRQGSWGVAALKHIASCSFGKDSLATILLALEHQIARSVNAGIAKPEDARRGLYLLDQVYELMFQVANK